MNEALTLGSLSQFIVMGLGILGLWWRVEHRVSAGANRAQEKADLVAAQLALFREMSAQNLNDFKLEVAEYYAKSDYIKNVEDRLIQRFDAIVKELHGMREDIQEAMVKMAETRVQTPTAIKRKRT